MQTPNYPTEIKVGNGELHESYFTYISRQFTSPNWALQPQGVKPLTKINQK